MSEMTEEKPRTWRDVIEDWWPIHKERMERLHQPVGDKYTVIGFHETIELARKGQAAKESGISEEQDKADQ